MTMKLKALSIITFLMISIILCGFEEDMTQYTFSGRIIDYNTGKGVSGIVLELEDINNEQILFSETNKNGEWFFKINNDNKVQDKYFMVTPRSSRNNIKFSPAQIFISNNAKVREELSVKAYHLNEAKDIVIEEYTGRYTGITYLGSNKWRFIFDIADYDGKIDRDEIESIRFGHELGRMDVNQYFTRQKNGIWTNEIDLNGLNPNSDPEKEKNYYPEQFEFRIILKKKGQEQEGLKSPVYIVGETHLLDMDPDVYVNNSREYGWYYPQRGSKYSSTNCGPAVIVMAAKWFDKSFPKTIDEVREEIGIPGEEGISNSDVVNYLDKYKIKNNEITNPTIDKMVDIIDQGKIIITGINPAYIRQNFGRRNFDINRELFDCGFDDDVGHGIIIKGYKKYKVKDKEFLLFEIYDPGLGIEEKKDKINKYIGENIHYFAEDVLRGMEELGASIIVVGDDGIKENTKNDVFKLEYKRLEFKP